MVAAGDTFRAAAVQQLTVWAERLGAEIVTGEMGSDPASVAHRAVATAVEKQRRRLYHRHRRALADAITFDGSAGKDPPCD